MSELQESTIDINGQPCRVWQKGSGDPLGYLAGVAGLPRWTPFLDKLAERRRVIVPALPGFAGAQGHTELDKHLDWLLATCDALSACGLNGADLIGASIGGALAADCAALWPDRIKRLVLIAPLGIFDADEPTADIFAHKPGRIGELLCHHSDNFAAMTAAPEGEWVEWQMAQVRALEASARLLWPLGDTGLSRRLQRITAPTLVLAGEHDQILPVSYAGKFAHGISGESRIQTIAGAGHLVDWDEPQAVADVIFDFLVDS
jgi:pimeloyl-ACP methyl ester carboxylesterase